MIIRKFEIMIEIYPNVLITAMCVIFLKTFPGIQCNMSFVVVVFFVFLSESAHMPRSNIQCNISEQLFWSWLLNT